MLVDTDLLIDFLRGDSRAFEFLELHADQLCMSAVTVAELYQGVREGKERTRLAETLSAFVVLPVTEEIAEKAGLLRREFRSKIGCGLGDCMIAATASHHGLRLATLNVRHFAMLPDVIEPYAKR